MAAGIAAVQQGGSSRREHSSSEGRGGGTMPDIGWLPFALGAAAVVAGLGGRRKGTVALTLTALAGVTAVDALRGRPSNGTKADHRARSGAAGDLQHVERSLTIGKSADELKRAWLDPKTLPRIMAGFATVRANGDGRTHWSVNLPLGRAYEWDTESAPDQSGDGIEWHSSPGAAIWNEGSIRFSSAPADRGTVATLRLRFDPPGGVLGDAAAKLLGHTPLDLAADGVLRRFKSLVETGEIPTTERQPAARADTR